MSLAKYILQLQQSGRLNFTKKEAMATLGFTAEHTKVSANRLIKKQALFMPKKGFYVIIPVASQARGFIDPILYLRDLMKFLNSNYYVGLLSAAQRYGAAHQQPQALQVITEKQIAPIIKTGAHIRFYKKKSFLDSKHIQAKKIDTGYVNVSSPELTALDLIKYPYAAGQINNIATVLSELEEQIKAPMLRQVIQEAQDRTSVQRLGYLFDYLDIIRLSKVCRSWLDKSTPNPIPLVANQDHMLSQLDQKWKIYVNEVVEPD